MNNIRAERDARGLSLSALARLTGIANSSLSRLERGVRPAREERHGKIAAALGVAWKDLFPSERVAALCLECGALWKSTSGQSRRYCSVECGNRYRNRVWARSSKARLTRRKWRKHNRHKCNHRERERRLADIQYWRARSRLYSRRRKVLNPGRVKEIAQKSADKHCLRIRSRRRALSCQPEFRARRRENLNRRYREDSVFREKRRNYSKIYAMFGHAVRNFGGFRKTPPEIMVMLRAVLDYRNSVNPRKEKSL